MQTYRCQHCGQVLAAFVSLIPGIALPMSNEAAMAQLKERQHAHAERCPARRTARAAS